MILRTLQAILLVAVMAVWGEARAAPEVHLPLFRVPSGAEVDRLMVAATDTSPPLQLDVPGIAEVWRMNELVIAGSAPPNEEALRALRKEGVRTLISIDFAPPDFYAAAAHGMAYVHVPMRYGHINSGELYNLLRVASWMEGNYYIHAAPGEIRALPVAAITAGWLENRSSERALFLLRRAGYPISRSAVWADIAGPYYYIDRARIDWVPEDFPEKVGMPPTIWWMQHMNESFAVLREAARFGWDAPPNYTETSPAAEAQSIAQSLERLGLLSGDSDAHKRELMEQAAQKARALQEAVEIKDRQAIGEAWEGLKFSCLECHIAYRDVE
ncbi:cytochrome c [bacterium]|nr:cytochrome c [bacterium]